MSEPEGESNITFAGQSKRNEEMSINIWRWLIVSRKYTENIDFYFVIELRVQLSIRSHLPDDEDEEEYHKNQKNEKKCYIDSNTWTLGALKLRIASIACFALRTENPFIIPFTCAFRLVVVL